MKLTTAKLYLIIGLTVFSLIGIVLIQYNWIDNALSLEEEKFNKQVSALFTEISGAVRQDCDLMMEIRNAAMGACDPSHPKPGEDVTMALNVAVKSVIDSVFAANHFTLDYEFGVMVPVSDEPDGWEVMLSSGDDPDPARFLHSRHKNYSALDRAAVISLYFPGEREYVARQIMFLLVLSILFILMVCAGFGYVILTINRQKKLSELKNDFINNLTHEFKTPIFSISLASKLLGRSEEINSSEKLNKYLNLIHNENNRLRTQVDKVLQMALIDSGNFHLNRKEVDIHAIIEQVCDAFSVMIEEKEGSIRLQLGAENKLLYADEAHLANLIYNLVDNGIKYSSGPPDITVATADTNEGLCLVIKDKGIGMDEHIQKHVFDKFYRARNGDLHEVKGFGLGLSYVKSIVKAHKGLIRLNSTKNAGSEFIITLPIN